MPIFLIREKPDAAGHFAISAEDLHHLTKVLRVGSGETFEVLLPSGQKGSARLEQAKRKYFGVLQSLENSATPNPLPLWIGIGLVRWPRVEWLVEKLSELGVARISLLHLQQGRLGKNDVISPNKIKRLEKIAQETLKQCGRGTCPQIDAPTSLQNFLKESTKTQSLKVIFQEKILKPLLPKVLETAPGVNSIFLFGPEGGFSTSESALAERHDFIPASLGKVILRAETAAIYATAVFDALISQSES